MRRLKFCCGVINDATFCHLGRKRAFILERERRPIIVPINPILQGSSEPRRAGDRIHGDERDLPTRREIRSVPSCSFRDRGGRTRTCACGRGRCFLLPPLFDSILSIPLEDRVRLPLLRIYGQRQAAAAAAADQNRNRSIGCPSSLRPLNKSDVCSTRDEGMRGREGVGPRGGEGVRWRRRAGVCSSTHYE